jgi:DNA-directed RNA polymerase specialized sigma24 family protein
MAQNSTTVPRSDVAEPIGMETWLTEETLARLFQSKEQKFVALVRMHLGPKLEKRIDPKDVCQDAFLRARARMKWLRGSLTQEELDQKLERLVCEQTIDQMRSVLGAKRNADIEVPLAEGSVAGLAMRLYHSQSTPSKALQRKEAIALVQHALDQLGVIDKRIVLWRTEFDLAHKVIGQVLEPEMAENAVNWRYIRALKKLRKLLPPADSFFER